MPGLPGAPGANGLQGPPGPAGPPGPTGVQIMDPSAFSGGFSVPTAAPAIPTGFSSSGYTAPVTGPPRSFPVPAPVPSGGSNAGVYRPAVPLAVGSPLSVPLEPEFPVSDAPSPAPSEAPSPAPSEPPSPAPAPISSRTVRLDRARLVEARQRISDARDGLTAAYSDWAKGVSIGGHGAFGEWRADRGPPYVQRLTMFAGTGVDQVGSGTLVRRILGIKMAFGRSCDLRCAESESFRSLHAHAFSRLVLQVMRTRLDR